MTQTHQRKKIIILSMGVMLLALTACGVDLAGEPEIVATIPPQAQQDTTQTVSLADVALGVQVYAENCTRCHGETGLGDGEFVLSGQITPEMMPNMVEIDAPRSETLQEWFGIITNGNIENLMPPWRESLSEEERWAVALYTYTLPYTSDQIMQGAEIWAAECATCHGETGQGDGPRAAGLGTPLPNFARLNNTVMSSSDADWLTVVAQGRGEAMPAYTDLLSAAERYAVVSFARTLAATNVSEIGSEAAQVVTNLETETETEPASTPQAVAEAQNEPEQSLPESVLGVVTGTVTNSTAGSEVPSDATAMLHIISEEFEEDTREINLSADSRFIFEDVPMRNDWMYFITVFHGEGYFTSDVARGDTANPSLDLPVQLLEMTNDPGVITISEMVTQFEPLPEGGVQAMQITTFRNESDRMYIRESGTEDTPLTSVGVPLPPGAQVISTPNTRQPTVISDDGSIVYDTRPVLPEDTHILHVMYFLPANRAVTVEQPVLYNFDGAAQVLATSPLALNSEQLQDRGEESFNDITYRTFANQLTLNANDVLSFEVSNIGATGAAPAAIVPTNSIALILAAAGVLVMLAGVVLYLRDRQKLGMDDLLLKIADLDSQHETGQIKTETYERQRAKLKARLARLMERNQ